MYYSGNRHVTETFDNTIQIQQVNTIQIQQVTKPSKTCVCSMTQSRDIEFYNIGIETSMSS